VAVFARRPGGVRLVVGRHLGRTSTAALVVGRHLGRTSTAALVGHPRHRTVGEFMTAWLTGVVAGRIEPGVYRWPSRAHPGAVGRELAGAGWGRYQLAGREVSDAGRFFDGCAGALAFPSWFGHSWEALADCLTDLTWLPGAGHVLLWERYGVLAAGDLKTWRRAYETVEGAVAARIRYAAPPLFVLLRGTGPRTSPVDGAPIPILPAVSGTAGSRPRRGR